MFSARTLPSGEPLYRRWAAFVDAGRLSRPAGTDHCMQHGASCLSTDRRAPKRARRKPVGRPGQRLGLGRARAAKCASEGFSKDFRLWECSCWFWRPCSRSSRPSWRGWRANVRPNAFWKFAHRSAGSVDRDHAVPAEARGQRRFRHSLKALLRRIPIVRHPEIAGGINGDVGNDLQSADVARRAARSARRSSCRAGSSWNVRRRAV